MDHRFARTAVRSLPLALCLATASGLPAAAGDLAFVEVAAEAGVAYEHGLTSGAGQRDPGRISGGVAAGDFDGDGFTDLFAVRGELGSALLYRNLGTGSFEEVAAEAGIDVPAGLASGPAFGDLDGDGALDLVVGGILGEPLRFFRNLGDGTFEELTGSGIEVAAENTYSTAFGDYDLDGDLDLFMTHWFGQACDPDPCGDHLWRNRGDGTFEEVDAVAGFQVPVGENDRTFTPNFADVDDDGWPDLLVASDFGQSRVHLNQRDGTFLDVTDPLVQTDQNGMGAAVGDYDGDGRLDWFVSSIWNNGDKTGNRLYRNLGGGAFEETSHAAGVRDGMWGWGSCFADVDNDGHLDIFHVNGWDTPAFVDDPARLFLNAGDGTFSEQAAALGLDETGQGRGVVCFDYDRDGDIDLFVANNSGFSSLWRNDGGDAAGWLAVSLEQPGGNAHGVGARIYLEAGGRTRVRELRMGSNFASQDPVEAHFGLGDDPFVDRMVVTWPDGTVSTHGPLAGERGLRVHRLFGDPSSVVYDSPRLFPVGCDLCQVEATVEVAGEHPGGTVSARLYGWLEDASTHVSVSLLPAVDKVVFRQVEAGGEVARRAAAAPLEEGVPYAVRIDFDGAAFRVYLDDLLLLGVPNGAAGTPSGDVVIRPVNAEVTVHNVAVTELR